MLFFSFLFSLGSCLSNRALIIVVMQVIVSRIFDCIVQYSVLRTGEGANVLIISAR